MLALIIFQALFFFLPGYIGNMMPVLFDKTGWLKSLNIPIDFRHTWKGEELFGLHKTYRGFVAGAFGGVLGVGLQILLYNFFIQIRWLFLFPYDSLLLLIFGFLLGFGSLLGDLVKSFMKRRLHIHNGAAFFPFDQLDFVMGGLLLGGLFYVPSWQHILVLFIFTPFLHFFANIVAYYVGWKKVWW